MHDQKDAPNRGNESPTAGEVRTVRSERRSALPLWGAAAVWVIAGIFAPMYMWYHYLIIAVLSAAVGLVIRAVAPPVAVYTEVPVSTGDADIDRILSAIREAKATLSAAMSVKPDDPSVADMERISGLLTKIADEIAADKGKDKSGAHMARRLDGYYLPTVCKLSDKYVKLQNLSPDGDIPNAKNTLDEIRRAYGIIAAAMQKQLDYMLGDDAIDISTDIDVLEAMLKRDGLN